MPIVDKITIMGHLDQVNYTLLKHSACQSPGSEFALRSVSALVRVLTSFSGLCTYLLGYISVSEWLKFSLRTVQLEGSVRSHVIQMLTRVLREENRTSDRNTMVCSPLPPDRHTDPDFTTTIYGTIDRRSYKQHLAPYIKT